MKVDLYVSSCVKTYRPYMFVDCIGFLLCRFMGSLYAGGLFFSIVGGHCRGFKVPFSGIVSGFVSLWLGCYCCCWCICFDRVVQKYLYISRGLVHVWAVTMHLPAIISTENDGVVYTNTIY